MDFSFSEDQEAIAQLARQIISGQATDDRIKALWHDPDWYDTELWTQLGEAGLLGIPLAGEFGGGDMGLIELAVLCEEAGRCIAPLPLLSTLVLAALPIQEFGSEEQKKRLLDGVAAGKTLLSAGLSELGRTDPARPSTAATRDGAGWVLNGQKVCVPDASRARRILVGARTAENEVGIFLVNPEQSGVTLERESTTNGEPQFTLKLDAVPVPTEDVLGDPARGADILTWIERRAVVALSALQLGISDASLGRTAAYASERKQFDRPIGSFQAVGMRSADAFIDVEAIRSTLYQAIWAIDSDHDVARAVEVAKWWACRAGHRVSHSVQHLHGGTGADVEYPIHRFFLWTKHTEYTLGGASAHLARLGKLLADGELR